MRNPHLHICLAVLFGWIAGAAWGRSVVSNAMSAATFPGLAAAVAAASDGDELVMIGDEVLDETLVLSNRVLSVVSDGAVRIIRAGPGCEYDMIAVVGNQSTLILGRPDGDDAAPSLILDGGRNHGVEHLFDLVFLDVGELVLHPGVVLRNLASVDVGALHSRAGLVWMLGGRIENNTALYGGGIYNNMGDVFVFGGSITGNVADVGGGIYNQAVELFMGYIVGYVGQLDVAGGKVAHNQATQAGGGIYSMGAMAMSAGEVRANAAEFGGGIVHFNGRFLENRDNGMRLHGNALVADNTAAVASGLYYNNNADTWLTIEGNAQIVPPNDVFMFTNQTPVLLGGPLPNSGVAAQLTPAAYSNHLPVLGTVGAENLWVVSNYYGKFTVTPEPDAELEWHVDAEGRLSHQDPAGLPAAIHHMQADADGLELDIVPAYVAWNGVLDRATGVVQRAWDFHPVDDTTYSVTNGRLTLAPDAATGVFRIRRE